LKEVVADCAKPFGGHVYDQHFWLNIMNDILVGPDASTYEKKSYVSPSEVDLEALATMLIVTAIGDHGTVLGIKTIEKPLLDLSRN
jgi:hypothetical protein